MKDTHLKEKTQHGLPDFPVQYYYIDSSHPRYEMVLHWHREFEIVRVQSGELELYVNNVSEVLRAGDIAFIGSGMMHRAEPHDAVYECVVFDLNMLCRHGSGRITGYILPLLSGEVEIGRVRAEEESGIPAAVEAFFACLAAEGRYFELKAYSAAGEIVFLLYTEGRIKLSKKHLHGTHRKETITMLIEWIEQNYTERITLGTLSEVAKLGEKYLCRFFKEYTGNSPIDYVNRLRVERACLKMAEENRNVTEAAFESGFNDISYFSKIFKRYKGMSPREYRHAVELHMQERTTSE